MASVSAAIAGTHALLPRVAARDAISALVQVIAPPILKGTIIRRPSMVALAAQMNLDRRGIRCLQRLREHYGLGPLLIGPVHGRYGALILAPTHVQRVLDESPEPFATATPEKRAALAHFEPANALISEGTARTDRRRFNEQALDTDQPIHHMAGRFVRVVREEALLLHDTTSAALTWERFITVWFRIVRRILFGNASRDHRSVTTLMGRLRGHANWAFLRPIDRRARDDLHAQLSALIAAAEPGSLAAHLRQLPVTDRTMPTHQITQWLFAFDPAAMVTFRALALLATHRAQEAVARLELPHAQNDAPQMFPYLRACVLDSARLWPTTPMILRESTTATTWDAGEMPAHTRMLIFTPFLHRDDLRVPFADQFAPMEWLPPLRPEDWPLIPFSAGPVRCPGRDLVLLVASTLLAELLRAGNPRLGGGALLSPHHPLPATLNHFRLRFRL